ncbi:MAG TPA: hypothetical protein VGU01_09520 [Sphingomicrobium sp.]|nr:hypothetical protein [Sphingomicrobium sp.]
MTQAAVATPVQHFALQTGLSLRALVSALLGLFAFDNILFLHFCGLSLGPTIGLALLSVGAITSLCTKISAELPLVSLRTVIMAFLISVVLFALGGEGRFFYANTDWQIRDAVLRDMAANPWPFAYDIRGTAYFLRAPVGLYLLPAMLGGSAELAMLVSNALRLAILMALAWHLFKGTRERFIALAVFLLFSGWDLVGTAIYASLGGHPSWDHIEAWNIGSQYSSHVTQAFWVPQHAIAGWTCAVAFMLWRKGMVPIGVFAASIPLVAIWSPLAIMGAVPFAVFAGILALKRGVVTWNDFSLAALAFAISLPALLYLRIDAASVGMRVHSMGIAVWVLCVGLEVLPFAWPLLRESGSRRSDRPVVLLILLLLLVMPLVQVGVSVDFQMRASIMPLALLAIFFANWICELCEETPVRILGIAYALLALTLGAPTPILEVRRALVNGTSPPPRCSLAGVWNKEDGMIVPYAMYLAPVSRLPAVLGNIPVTAGRSDPQKCWDRKWVTPSAG